ncbi:MAG TPA: ankyrin repeat domain-containing protein [Chlamydiales bacterium]|nr:ankyrin repeat domain-containing protein [Chlamydiales bacterium]
MAAPAGLAQIQQLLVPLTEKPKPRIWLDEFMNLTIASKMASKLGPEDGPRIQKVFNEYVASMVQHKCNVNRKYVRNPPALNAIADGHLFSLVALLESRADPNVKDESGYSLLDAAALRGRPEMVDLLISYGSKTGLLQKTPEALLVMAKELKQPRWPA